MITEQDLQEAIAECQGQRNPTASTCIKLASYYIIQDRMNSNLKEPNETQNNQFPLSSYSYSDDPGKIKYVSSTEFSEAIFGRSPDEIFPIIDELMTVLQAINPRLYNGVMAKIAT